MSDPSDHIDAEPIDNKPEPSLRLAESSEGSTQPIDAGPDASDDSTKSAGASQSAAGGTTGGFETMLGKLVVQAGFVTDDEIDQASIVVEASGDSDIPLTLTDALIDRDYLTQHQLNRLRQEFEAKKSTQQIPGFKIMKKLGAGAMATVFLARQISLDRLVAIKILPKKFSNNQKFIERFVKEGRAAAQLNHPNIVGAYDVGQSGEHHYFVMEYVDGETVHDRMVAHKRFGEREAIEVVKQVAKALSHAHERGFIHRDIKPKNVMISKKGRVKLADLGLARALSDVDAAKAEAGRAYGTPYYISPEQIRGEVKIGVQADLYGLGATFFHMVTGRVPFEGKNPSAVMHKHLKEALEPPDHLNPEISAGCAQIIEMLMAKSRRDRYQTSADLIEDLDLVAQSKPPHFAHRAFDHVSISETLTDVAAAAETAPPVHHSGNRGHRSQDPVFLAIAGLAALSTLAAVFFALLLLT